MIDDNDTLECGGKAWFCRKHGKWDGNNVDECRMCQSQTQYFKVLAKVSGINDAADAIARCYEPARRAWAARLSGVPIELIDMDTPKPDRIEVIMRTAEPTMAEDSEQLRLF